MRHIYRIVVTIAVLLCILAACKAGIGGKTRGDPPAAETFDKDSSYSLGMVMGSSLVIDGIYPNIDEFARGIRDTLYGSKTRFTAEESHEILNDAFNLLAERREAHIRDVENEFLAENSKKPGINITQSGLQYEVIREGTGAKPTIDDSVLVHYEGTFTNGIVFDSSYSRGEPIELPLFGVISGWTEALQLMGVGSIYRLIVPSNLAYGPQGWQQIPPYSTLLFEIELLDIIQEKEE
jgi:FKBP-type peptidyl-prolyl cis-trans isomerase